MYPGGIQQAYYSESVRTVPLGLRLGLTVPVSNPSPLKVRHIVFAGRKCEVGVKTISIHVLAVDKKRTVPPRRRPRGYRPHRKLCLSYFAGRPGSSELAKGREDAAGGLRGAIVDYGSVLNLE